MATALSAIGLVLVWWHGSVLAASTDAPVTALLGTGLLLVVSAVLVGAGGWLLFGDVAPERALPTGYWVVLMTAAFATVGVLVSLHLDFEASGFDGAPLVADLVTVGVAVGVLVGQYDARVGQYPVSLREERNRFASLFDNLPNPAVHHRCDDSTAVLDVNDAFEDVFGFDAAAARGRSVASLVAPGGDPVGGDTPAHGFREGVATAVERRQLTATGLREFDVITVPYRDDEGFSIWIDATDRKLQIRRLEVFNRVLRHDLRTDANVIAGNAGLLRDSPEADTIRERALALAERGAAARRAEEALDETANRRPVDLGAVLEARTAGLGGATVHADLGETTVYGSTALGTAIDELLANAVEHNDSADPTLWITIDGVSEDTTSDGRFVTLEIADDGPGLPEMEHQVFEAGSETPLQHSSGLGLWLARLVVKDLGGEMTVGDREPRGTVVTVRLPPAAPGQRSVDENVSG